MRKVVAILALGVLSLSCSASTDPGSGTERSASSTASPASEPPSTSASPTSVDVLSGMFDVGGYSLHLRCEGSGLPTVVYLHGYSHLAGDADGSSAGALPSMVSEQGYRFCAYDRANTGTSDDVPGPLTGRSSVKDLHRLLEVAGMEPPYVLLGASFGGLLAYLYAAIHPDEVVGMVLLDAAFPDELSLEHLWPADERWTHEEFVGTNEELDQLAAFEEASAFIGREPTIPVTYLLAEPSTWTGPPEYEAVILDVMAGYVDRFSPGVLRAVESPHYMEVAVPDRIVLELEELIESLVG